MSATATISPQPYRRVMGSERDELGGQLKTRYDAGESIRDIADDLNRSFGFVRNVLVEAGVTLRGRGGNNRRK